MTGTTVTTADPAQPGFDRLVRRVAAIAEELAYGGDAAGAGRASFLLSGFGSGDYDAFARDGRLLVVKEDGEPVAFAVVYPPDVPADRSDAGTQYIRATYGAVPVIKQIATAPGHERRGYSSLLYRWFAEQHRCLPLFAAIAERPRNLGSEQFHRKLGFTKCATFSGHPDGRPRGIWGRPPRGEDMAKACSAEANAGSAQTTRPAQPSRM